MRWRWSRIECGAAGAARCVRPPGPARSGSQAVRASRSAASPAGGRGLGRGPACARTGESGPAKRRRPRKRDSGARINRYRCCLPALAGFSIYRRGGANGATIGSCVGGGARAGRAGTLPEGRHSAPSGSAAQTRAASAAAGACGPMPRFAARAVPMRAARGRRRSRPRERIAAVCGQRRESQPACVPVAARSRRRPSANARAGKRKAPDRSGAFARIWRREGDSNPRSAV